MKIKFNPMKFIAPIVYFLCSNNQMQTFLSNWNSKRNGGKGEEHVSWGDEFPDKTFYVIRRENLWGLMSIVQAVTQHIAYARRRNYIPVVDMCTVPSLYLEDWQVGGTINAWEWFFEQPGGYTLEDIRHAKNVVISCQNLLGKYYGVAYTKFSDKKLLQTWNDFATKNIAISSDASAYIESMRETVFGKIPSNKVVGVYCRGTDYVDLRPKGHPIQPDAEEVMEKAKEWMEEYQLEACYLVTEDARVLEKFKSVFGDKLLYNASARRSGAASHDQDYIYTRDQGDDRRKNGLDYLANMMLLSGCDYVMGGITGGTTGFLFLNQKQFTKSYWWDLGRY